MVTKGRKRKRSSMGSTKASRKRIKYASLITTHTGNDIFVV